MSAQPASQTVAQLSTRVDVVAFRKALQAATKLAGRAKTPQVIALRADRTGLTLDTGDEETHVTMRVPGWSGTGSRVAIPAGDLKRLLRAVPAGSATLDVAEDVTLTVGDVLATCRPAEAAWTPVPKVDGKPVDLDPDEFDLLARIATAAATDAGRPVIESVQLDGTIARATDSYRLVFGRVSRRRMADGALVPAALIPKVAAAARGRDVTLTCDEKHVRLAWTRDDIDTTVTAALVEGSYPDTKKLVDQLCEAPADAVEVDRQDVLAVVARHVAVAHGNYSCPTQFVVTDDGVTVTTRNYPAELVEPVGFPWPGESAFRGEFLSSVFRTVTDETVTVEFRSALKPLLVRDSNVTALLMPMRVS